jgi:23S rRNA (adenine2503-C2)-methyltransferase
MDSDLLNPSPAQAPADPRKNLVGLSREALVGEMAAFGEASFRARQLWHWIYHRGATDFAIMTTLSKTFRERLAEAYVVRRPVVSRALASVDGTRKWLLRFPDGQEVETVHIPEEDRGTLCVSSQVGCTLTCKFCHTGTQRLVRNLDPGEIVGQVMVARDALGEWPSPAEDRQLTNIVLMGMGEPLYNYEAVATALRIVMDQEGLSLSKRKITLSTSGVVPAIKRCGAELGVNLAISLHAVTDELRDVLVPLNKKYPIAELLDACRNYPGSSNSRASTTRRPRRAPWSACCAASPPRSTSSRSTHGRARLTNARPARRSSSSATSSSRPAIPRRCARRAARTSWRPAASSNRTASRSGAASC